MRHIEVNAPGELLNQDTFYWGTLKGVGKVYVQVVVDAFCSLAFAKVYTSKMPVTAAELLYDRVLPFYEALGVEVKAVLTDNGREFCGRPESHPLRTDACVARRRASHDEGAQPENQRLCRMHEPHLARRMLPNQGSGQMVRDARGDSAGP